MNMKRGRMSAVPSILSFSVRKTHFRVVTPSRRFLSLAVASDPLLAPGGAERKVGAAGKT
jgi:hypothetical protein